MHIVTLNRTKGPVVISLGGGVGGKGGFGAKQCKI